METISLELPYLVQSGVQMLSNSALLKQRHIKKNIKKTFKALVSGIMVLITVATRMKRLICDTINMDLLLAVDHKVLVLRTPIQHLCSCLQVKCASFNCGWVVWETVAKQSVHWMPGERSVFLTWGGGGTFCIITHLSHGTRSWYSYLTITSHYFHWKNKQIKARGRSQLEKPAQELLIFIFIT